jgi:hypothetical protein
VLGRQEYHQQSRHARALLRSYLAKMTGLSRARVTRLIARYRKSGSLQPAPYRRHRFPQRYTRADLVTPCACSSSTPPTSIPISTTIVRAPKPTSPSTRKAVGVASTAVIRPRWRPGWPCPTRRSICAEDSPPPSYSASRKLAATPKPRSACSKRNADSSRRCAGPWEGRGNDGREKSPQPPRVSLPWKAQKTKARHSHHPGYAC